jgi:hypothetical protein
MSWLQWAKVARSVAMSKIPLYVNMDETSVCVNYAGGRGLVVSRKSLPPGKKHRKEQISSSDAKARVSLLTFLTHSSEIQPHLPQILLGNKHRLLVSLLQQLTPHIPANFHVWREESSWVNHVIMRRVLCLLVLSLQAFMATYQIILVLDCARCHIHPTIFALATRLGVRLLYVPAKLTFLLQPADTHCFSRLKQKLRQKWMQLKVDSSSGEISHLEWFIAMLQIVSQVLCSNRWEPAFLSVGLLDERKLSSRVLNHLGWDSPVAIPNDIPSVAQLQNIFPRRSRIFRDSLFSWALPKPKAQPKPLPKARAPDAIPQYISSISLSLDGPISSRTRKRSFAEVV